ncbi:MAG: 23S rRNA (uracil(1939)-C(5))-methyltransferase RlmD [Streptococcaceae bacterium]|jgi:23S rRNA (uracil-5-)-methyltransferase RumA|nr:23S rRNA (uracil(1939)-C(5))-methyltransferase RlmD [Streptococcaceae bacterium]
MVNLEINQKLKVKIKRIGINGEGITRYKGRLIFIENALPKEEVIIKISSNERNFSTGQLVKINKASTSRVTPPCPVYQSCGGCQLMHLDYPAQLAFKVDLIKQALEKFKPTDFKDYKILPTIGQEEPWHYRNKLQFQIRRNHKNGKVEAGLFAINSHHLVKISDCCVQMPKTQRIINTCVKLFETLKITPYNEKKNDGFIKTVMVRESFTTKEVQLILVTTSKNFPKWPEFKRQLIKKHPEIVTIEQNIQSKQTSKIYGTHQLHLYGQSNITESILDKSFTISPLSFLQLNYLQMNKLYHEAIKAMDLKSDDKIIDAYCGAGKIGLSLAEKVSEVRGMDTMAPAIKDAKNNAKALGLDNAIYEVGSAEQVIPRWIKEGFSATGLIVDPPRSGIDAKLLDVIIKNPTEKFVYISCNMSTLARDLVALTQVYRVSFIQPVDMFPHTARGEAIVLLRRC